MMIILILIRCSGWMTKAKKVCPDSLALIGIYGSVATGDAYEKSDLFFKCGRICYKLFM